MAFRTRINNQIRVPEVRLIDDQGKMLGIMKIEEAMALAKEREVDLVEVSPTAKPPVVKLLDYDKYRYQQEKAAQEARKKVKKVMVKGIRLSVRIGDHDLVFKAKKTSEFLAEGHKIKVDVVMRGREQAHPELAFNLMKRFQETITTPFVKETGPSRMGGTISIIIAPSSKS
ncbi:MAG: translation initiation factor IF-3 [Candidatus Doudnabacteria bacterium RIFCSPLOWO2_02_FULL_49_13]|uniref:Translation initiation factor IF-3 n=1 Tax=Candidatus Doudnabacteria bacterium RIFCSPHIGHO2_12_FULL_48_16 TaxID=1817838 RepID=A0A1F5PLJ7_9BACT|nr:MAG: translation initiation factor IF-3 [Candidatus Doudnabacteria bacterium RIFCSPHIGHO2_02_FULL_49_24]OGE90747.1 MAG: translation initiation factor IF-3 [Candidatus Doudnabacteria bacterium RIFCSPHIGHO2_12_FULL_48_16]OGE97331.1 MAG: translation initiation factor IF-3 [Candidatus Doudnabacteria bacterium RIFCSPLOWO2_01_FULL_49_40]OGF02610.1 MAG: translation initiation factor IF-3 [Candidatus Doudnabacteria bacterium RIFCSPLOWO2_02_FULL_49_13]OGF03640.1 MAG: translation initiation factor IF-